MFQHGGIASGSAKFKLGARKAWPLCLAAALFLAHPASAQFNDKWASFQQSPSSLPSGAQLSDDNHETDLAWGDIDLDGDTDLVIVRKEPFTTTGMRTNVLLLNESGVLVDRTAAFASASDVAGDLGFLTATNDRDVVLVDLTGDGYPEIITAPEHTIGQPKHIHHPRIYVNLGRVGGVWQGFRYEDSRFPALLHLASGVLLEPRFMAVAAGDVNNDGAVDLYFGDHDTGTTLFGSLQHESEDTEDRLLINDGNGFFTDATALSLSPAMILSKFCNSVVLADVNQDGAVDVIKQLTYQFPEYLSVAYNDPLNPGSFAVHTTGIAPAPYFINAGDLNSDGRLDLAVTSNENDFVLFNMGNKPAGDVNWSATKDVQFLSGGEPAGYLGLTYSSNNLIADLDGDGWDELLIADVDVEIPTYAPDFRLHLYHNRGGTVGGDDIDLVEERASLSDNNWVGAHGLLPDDLRWTHDVAVFDVNGDGAMDMILSRREGTQVWLQVAAPTCQEDLGYGDGPILEVCGGDLSTGNDAQLTLMGALPQTPMFLAIGPSSLPTQILGATVVPFPITSVIALTTDATGELTVPVPGGGGSATLVVQAFQLGVTPISSSAIKVDFKP